MALPKKGLRKIVVNEVEYFWTTRVYNEFKEDIWITIALGSNQKRMLHYDYNIEKKYEKSKTIEYKNDGTTEVHINLNEKGQYTSVTSRVIKQIIEAALKNGWEKAPDGIFDSHKYSHDLLKSIGSIFQIDILKNKIVEEKNFSYLDIDTWAYSPAKGYGEFYYLFYQETMTSNSKSQEQVISEYHQNEKFIVKVLSRYGKFLKIPHDNLKDFLSKQNFVNKPLSEEEIETHLSQFLKSNEAPLKVKEMKIESANYIFIESLSYGLIAKTKNGLLGLIWDHPG